MCWTSSSQTDCPQANADVVIVRIMEALCLGSPFLICICLTYTSVPQPGLDNLTDSPHTGAAVVGSGTVVIGMFSNRASARV